MYGLASGLPDLALVPEAPTGIGLIKKGQHHLLLLLPLPLPLPSALPTSMHGSLPDYRDSCAPPVTHSRVCTHREKQGQETEWMRCTMLAMREGRARGRGGRERRQKWMRFKCCQLVFGSPISRALRVMWCRCAHLTPSLCVHEASCHSASHL